MFKQVNVTEKVKVRRRNASSVPPSLNSSLVQVKVKTCQAEIDNLFVTSRGEISSAESADEASVVTNCENRKVQPARVFVISKSKKPLMPCSRKRAHQLLRNGKAVVLKGKKIGKYVGRVAVRKSGSFNITVGQNIIQGISYKNCKIIQRADGYKYKQHEL